MCFSASASFVASGLLATVSALSYAKARTSRLSFISLAPLFFALQQIAEGLVWLTISNPASTAAQLSVQIFLFFAFAWWPLSVPYSIYKAELQSSRKKLLILPCIAGALFALLAYIPTLYYGATAIVGDHHIHYLVPHEHFLISTSFATLLYALAVVAPMFISSIAKMWVAGVGVAVGYWVAFIWFYQYITSVWCFFAAIVSASVLYIVFSNTQRKQ